MQGGAERQMVETSRLLKAHGHDVTLYIYDLRKAFYRVENELQVVDIRLRYRWMPEGLNKVISIFSFAQMLRRTQPDYAISYVTFLNITLGFTGWLNYHNPKTKFIGSERNSSLRFVNSLYWALICRLMYRGLDAMTANNPPAIEHLKKIIHYDPNRLFYIPNLLDIDFFSRQMQPINDGIYRILVPARITYQKNQHILPSLAKQLRTLNRPFKFVLAGYLDGAYGEILLEKIQQEDVAEHFELLGNVPNIRDLYQQCDLILMPSRYEGLSNSLIEAMACESLVAASAIDEFTDLILDGENGFVLHVTDPETLFAQLKYILNLGPDEVQRIRNNARHSVLRFGPETYYQNFMQILKAVT